METSTKNTHTPGPWHIIHEPTLNTYHIRVEDLDAAPVASLFYSSGGSRPQLSRELIDANAALIAASPDMLAALQGIIRSAAYESGQAEPSLRELTVGIKYLDAARAAIAKAEGGAE